jgi:hypothetical protein
METEEERVKREDYMRKREAFFSEISAAKAKSLIKDRLLELAKR